MEERRLLVAVALSLLVLTGYSLLFSPAPRPRATEPPAAETPVPEATARGLERPPLAPDLAATPGPPPEAPVPTIAAERETRVEIVGGRFTVAFSNRGARLLSWRLTEYLDAQGRAEEMVPAVTPGVRPLDIETGDAGLDARLRDALFLPSVETLRLDGPEPRTLRFTFSDREVSAEKVLTFRDRGLVEVSVTVRQGDRPVPRRLVWGPGLGNPSEEERGVRGYEEPQGVAFIRGAVERLAPKKLGPSGQVLRGVSWVGIESRYFAALLVPPSGTAEAEIRPETLPRATDEGPAIAASAVVEAADRRPLLLYVGPKDHQELKRLGHGLERVVPVGDWIGPIVVPLMRLLRWVHGLVGNWGWSIVILTVLINLVMAPLRHYSIANSLKMAKISPEMKVIQERYKKVPLMDPRRQQMQEEMAALYAKHGMSMGTQMMVGCLPLLLTMPFLFAFYRVLMVSVELRGAPFLWIPDLSSKDPLFLTPVLMGVSMYAMQKMTPTTLEPAQQRIMMLMPVMLAGMFLWAPAGLNLYWLTANLWSILQQVVEMRVLQPAGARRTPTRPRERRRR